MSAIIQCFGFTVEPLGLIPYYRRRRRYTFVDNGQRVVLVHE